MALLAKIYLLVVLIVGFSFSASANESSYTALDKAHKAVLESQDNIPAYYQELLGHMLYIYVASQNASNADELIEVQLRTSNFKDIPLVNAFDTYERAVDFGKSRGFPENEILEVKAQGVFRLMLTRYYVYLNPETQYEKLFSPDEVLYVSGIGNGYAESRMATKNLGPLETVTPLEGKFAIAIRNIVDDISNIKAAYICRHPDETLPPGQDNYLVVLRVKRKSKNPDFGEIYKYLEGNISDVGIIDFAFAQKKDLKKLIVQGEKPFYRK